LDFNLSHTPGLAAVAVSRATCVGVDAETIDRSGEHLELADRYFSPEEARSLRALPPELRLWRFLELWTLKEAYAKACGMGLSLPLDSVAFAVVPGRPPRATFAREFAEERDSWQFAVLRPTSQHVLALARSGPCPLLPRLFVASSTALRTAASADP
jgi:4'-phosphopantetheinyl transferase